MSASSHSHAVSIIHDSAPTTVGSPARPAVKPDPETEKLTPVKSLPGQAEAQDGEDVLGPPPDGGLDAWLCVFSAMFLPFCIFGFSGFPAQPR